MSVIEPTEPSRAGAIAAVGYALACYAGFVLVFLYAVGFLANAVVPLSVDRGGPSAPYAVAVLVDALLLGVFAVQHSVMARPAFKERWTRLVPRHVERSTYVLLSTLALALVCRQWRPIPQVVWEVSWPPARVAIWGVCAGGWLWALAMTYAIDHVGLFGLRQATRHLRGLEETDPGFVVPWPYRLVRHPMMVGFAVAFVATPRMTVGHLLFAVLGIAYICAGVRLEERDLSAALPEYDAYAATTPSLVPRPMSRPESRPASRSGRR
jgi:protein-S-isoprenylcysteine O-methyltransferase Ste14